MDPSLLWQTASRSRGMLSSRLVFPQLSPPTYCTNLDEVLRFAGVGSIPARTRLCSSQRFSICLQSDDDPPTNINIECINRLKLSSDSTRIHNYPDRSPEIWLAFRIINIQSRYHQQTKRNAAYSLADSIWGVHSVSYCAGYEQCQVISLPGHVCWTHLHNSIISYIIVG